MLGVCVEFIVYALLIPFFSSELAHLPSCPEIFISDTANDALQHCKNEGHSLWQLPAKEQGEGRLIDSVITLTAAEA